MNRLTAFLKLIRIQNLLILSFVLFTLKYQFINYYIINPVLSNYNFFLLIISTILIMAGGYIINDIYDIKTDEINNTQILNKYLNIKYIKWVYIALNILGICVGSYLAFQINIPRYSLIFIFSSLSLWIYSKKLKRLLLIGNILIAFLIIVSILNIGLFDIYSNGFSKEELIIFKVITYYASFAGLITLFREIIKDVEDIKGDISIKATTLAIKYGTKNTKRIALTIIIFTSMLIGYFQYFQYSIINTKFEYNISVWGGNQLSLLYTVLIQILFLLIIIKTYNAQTKEDFSTISTISKIIMIIGIISIPTFTYLHLNNA